MLKINCRFLKWQFIECVLLFCVSILQIKNFIGYKKGCESFLGELEPCYKITSLGLIFHPSKSSYITYSVNYYLNKSKSKINRFKSKIKCFQVNNIF